MTSRMGAPIRPRHSRILGLGTYRLDRVVANKEIAPGLGLDETWIAKRSGVLTRRYAGSHEPLEAMASAAAAKCLSAAGVEPGQVGCVIAATTTHLTQMPSLASAVAHQIGAAGAAAF